MLGRALSSVAGPFFWSVFLLSCLVFMLSFLAVALRWEPTLLSTFLVVTDNFTRILRELPLAPLYSLELLMPDSFAGVLRELLFAQRLTVCIWQDYYGILVFIVTGIFFIIVYLYSLYVNLYVYAMSCMPCGENKCSCGSRVLEGVWCTERRVV